MSFELTYDDSKTRKLMSNLSTLDTQRILNDASTILLNSAKQGFVKKKDPDGKPWPVSDDWYADMKGQKTPLTGPQSKKISRGRFKGWEFKKVNSTRMANELWKTVGKDRAEVFYRAKAKKRAKINQFGGQSKMVIQKGNRQIEFDIKVRPRIHLGVSDSYSRIDGDTDIGHIETMIDEYINSLITGV